MEVGYWHFRGLANPIWLLLAHENAEWKPRFFETPESYFGNKDSLGLDFPNLPFIVDGETKVSETSAIPHYIAHKLGKPELLGKPGLDHIKHFEIMGVQQDILANFLKIIGAKEEGGKVFDEVKDRFFYPKFEKLGKFLGEKDFLLGYVTYSDIHLAFLVQNLEKVANTLERPSFFEKNPNLKTHAERVMALPGIKAHLESDLAKLPLVSKDRNFFDL